MTKKTKVAPKNPPKSQSELFIEKARELGCDEGADEEVMRHLAGQERRAPQKSKPSKK